MKEYMQDKTTKL